MSDPRPVVVTVALPESALEKLRARFKVVHYHPDGQVLSVKLPDVQLWLAKNIGLPPCAGPISELTALKHIQLVSAGAEKALANELIKAYAASPAASRPDAVTLSTASGLHVLSIPNYVVAMIINIYSQIYRQVSFCRVSSEPESGRSRLTFCSRRKAGPRVTSSTNLASLPFSTG